MHTAEVSTRLVEASKRYARGMIAEWLIRMISIHFLTPFRPTLQVMESTGAACDRDEFGRVLFPIPGYGSC
jgi:hypothetical protein